MTNHLAAIRPSALKIASVIAIVSSACYVFAQSAATPLQIVWQPLHEPGSGGALVSVAVSPFEAKRVIAAGDMLGVAISRDGGSSWQATSGFPSWEMGAITWSPVDPQVVWIGSMSGPCKSMDGGITWTLQRSGLGPIGNSYYSVPIEKVLFDPANIHHLLAFGGSHRQWPSLAGVKWGDVWESTDDGSTWSQVSQLGDSATAYGVMAAAYSAGPAPYLLYAALNAAGIWQSADNGRTWQKLSSGLPPNLPPSYISTDPFDRNTAYAAFTADANGDPGGIWKTTNAGVTWTAINNGLGQLSASNPGVVSRYAVVETSPSQPKLLITADLSWWNSFAYRSTDGGATWQTATTSAHFYGGAASAFALGFDPNNSNSIFMATQAFLNRSLDGGQTWTDILAAPVVSPPAVSEFWRGAGFSGLVSANVKFNPLTHSVILMGLDDGKWVESRDGLQTWRWGGSGMNHYSGGDDATFSQAPGQAQTVYFTAGQWNSLDGILKSADGGETWAYVTQPDASGLPIGIYALPDKPNSVWVVQNSKLYYSTDGANSWALVTSGGIDNDGGLSYIAADPTNKAKFYVNGAQGVWATSDGVSFALMPGSPTNTAKMIVDPTNAARLYVTKWRTPDADNGLHCYNKGVWTLLKAEYALRSVDVDPTNGQRMIVSTDDDPFHDVSAASGVYLSTDGGTSWTQQNSGLAMLRGGIVRFLPWDPSRVILGTNGRGFWIGKIAPALLPPKPLPCRANPVSGRHCEAAQ